jgi:hypothetical protein
MRTASALVAILAATALVVTGCGGSDEPAGASGEPASGASSDGKVVTIQLDAQNDSGESGTATLNSQGAQTKVVLALENPASESPQPAHIHKGTCEDLDPAPAYPLANVTAGASETMVDVPLEELEGGRFAINVHKSETEAEIYVACGTVGTGGEDDGGSGPGYGY